MPKTAFSHKFKMAFYLFSHKFTLSQHPRLIECDDSFDDAVFFFFGGIEVVFEVGTEHFGKELPPPCHKAASKLFDKVAKCLVRRVVKDFFTTKLDQEQIALFMKSQQTNHIGWDIHKFVVTFVEIFTIN